MVFRSDRMQFLILPNAFRAFIIREIEQLQCHIHKSAELVECVSGMKNERVLGKSVPSPMRNTYLYAQFPRETRFGEMQEKNSTRTPGTRSYHMQVISHE